MTILKPSAATGKDVLFSLQAITSLLEIKRCSANEALVKGRFPAYFTWPMEAPQSAAIRWSLKA